MTTMGPFLKKPVNGDPSTECLDKIQTWGWDSIDCHYDVPSENEEPSYQHEWSHLGLSHMIAFLAFLPVTFLLKTIVHNSGDVVVSL